MRLVKVPFAGVVAPITVELIPVGVVLKLEDVNVNVFPPASIEEAFSPERVSVPELAVKLIAPPDCVNPLEAVRVPADVTVPVPVV